MKTLIYRAYGLCTRNRNREEELEFLKDTFIANACPVNVLDSVLKKYIPHKNKTQPNKEKSKHQIDFGKVFQKE